MDEKQYKEKDIEIFVKLGQLEEKINQLLFMRETILDAMSTATEAKNSSSSAHKRIDENDKKIEKINSIIKWVATTIIGAVILALMGFVLTSGGK